ncbi:MAG: sulfite exporter TauE/SafE family protein [Chloroflexi bacterium]|nr:sulfite exporter TauE/SafE family protein [Chloroflexota bacterium]
MDLEEVSLLIAFAAGLLSFLSPCVLPLVPAYITHLTGASMAQGQRRRFHLAPFLHAAGFVAGFSLVFIVLGASVGLIGYTLRDQIPLLSRVGGIVLILLGLNLMGVLRIGALYQTRQLQYSAGRRVSYARSALIGATFSVGWTPCVGPILGAILTLAATSETVLTGAYLLLAFSLGLGVPFLAAGAALGSLAPHLKRLSRHGRVISIVSGLLLIGVGILMVLGKLADLNAYFSFLGTGGI